MQNLNGGKAIAVCECDRLWPQFGHSSGEKEANYTEKFGGGGRFQNSEAVETIDLDLLYRFVLNPLQKSQSQMKHRSKLMAHDSSATV
jgi:hypothetical protein